MAGPLHLEAVERVKDKTRERFHYLKVGVTKEQWTEAGEEGEPYDVFALLYRMMGAARRDRVEDLAQETFLSVFRSLGQFAPLGPARLSSWILTIASRRAIDELRRTGGDAPAALDGEAALVSPARADDRARRRDLGQRVERAIGELGAELRAAFLLREMHGLEYAEIARALSIDLGTVKSRLSRARAALRAALADLEEDGDVA